jgi:hypothetical protein
MADDVSGHRRGGGERKGGSDKVGKEEGRKGGRETCVNQERSKRSYRSCGR